MLFLTLKGLPICKGFHVQFHSGNSMVVKCINRRGQPNFMLTALIFAILHQAIKRLFFLASHVANVIYIIVDSLS